MCYIQFSVSGLVYMLCVCIRITKNFFNGIMMLLNNSHFSLVPKLKCEAEFTFLSYKYTIAKMC